MFNTREELIELLLGWGGLSNCAEDMADYLIANGVTIPVRCKDCKYQDRASCPTYYEDRMTYRDCWALDGDNDFCSDGVRRDEE